MVSEVSQAKLKEWDRSHPRHWQDRREQYKRYHRLAKALEESEQLQINILLYTMGGARENSETVPRNC